jgi:hypothetical protein
MWLPDASALVRTAGIRGALQLIALRHEVGEVTGHGSVAKDILVQYDFEGHGSISDPLIVAMFTRFISMARFNNIIYR